MQARLDPILRKHKVDMYICGHIHNFQHVRMAGSDIDYITNSLRFARPQGEAHRRDRILQPRTGFLHCIGQQKDTGTAHD